MNLAAYFGLTILSTATSAPTGRPFICCMVSFRFAHLPSAPIDNSELSIALSLVDVLLQAIKSARYPSGVPCLNVGLIES
jgi:hypothetical protein